MITCGSYLESVALHSTKKKKLARLGLAIEIVHTVTFKVSFPDVDSFRCGKSGGAAGQKLR